MRLEEVLARFNRVKRCGSGYKAECPAHDDKRQSLFISEKDNKILMHCYAGCDIRDIVNAVGLQMKDLFKEEINNHKKSKKDNIVAIYPYIDLKGNVVFEKIRFKPKSFAQRRPTGDGGYIWGLDKGKYYETYPGSNNWSRKERNTASREFDSIEPILYNLPNLVKAIERNETVFIVEGEKDVENLKKLGLTATCNFDGASKNIQKSKWRESYNQYFKNADVVILPDNDDSGIAHAEHIAKSLNGIASSIRIVKLPGLPEKGDVSDWLENGGTKEELIKLVRNTPVYVDFKPKNNYIYEYDNCYWKPGKKGNEQLSNFIISLNTRVVSKENEEVNEEVQATFITDTGKKINRTFQINCFNSVKQFSEMLQSGDLTFFGTDRDLKRVKDHVFKKECKIKRGVECLGFHKINDKWLFVTGEGAIDEEFNQVDDVVIIDKCKKIDTDILSVEPITKEELSIIGQAIFNFNSLEKTAVIMGTLASFFLKEKLWRCGYKMHHLMIYGESGSGKSETLENIIMPFFSINSKLSAGNITNFVLLKNLSSSNTIPIIIDEYKPGFMSKSKVNIISEYLRNIYDHNEGERGTKDQNLNTYFLTTPVVIAGEEGIEETAIKERSLILNFNKLDIDNPLRSQAFQILKENKHLISKLGRSALNLAMKIDSRYIKEKKKCIDEKLISNSIKTPRLRNSISNCILGIFILNEIYKKVGLDFQQVTEIKLRDIVIAISRVVFEENLDRRSTSKTIIENTLEILDSMAANNELIKGLDYKIINNGTELALNVNRFYDRLTGYVKKNHVSIEILKTKSQFTKQLRKTHYFVDYKKVRLFDEINDKSKPIHCYVLDVKKLVDRGLELYNILGEKENVEDKAI